MAAIGKIRKHSGLLVVMIGVSLALFILSDFVGNNSGGSGGPSEGIGEIYGSEVDYVEFMNEVETIVVENFTNQGGSPTDDQMEQIREYVWSHKINKTIYDKQFSSFGITVTPREMEDLIFGNNIQPDIQSNEMFKDSATGQFSLTKIKRFRQEADQNPTYRNYWVNNIEKPLIENRSVAKYFNMISKGLYVTAAEANADYINNTRKLKVRFIQARYSDIADSIITVTEEEIKEYYDKNKHRKKFHNQSDSRKFSFVEFPMVVSEYDINEAKGKAAGLIAAFIASTNDSDYVMRYADTKIFNNEVSNTPFPLEVDSMVQAADTGDVIGPYRDGNAFKIVKVRGITFETEATCRHILLSNTKGTIDQLKKRGDSIINVIKRKNNFAEMVSKFTDDPGSKDSGGIYRWFPKGRMVKPFEEASFNGPLNKMQLVETDYGIHIVEPLARRESKRITQAIVDITITALIQSQTEAKAKAFEFYKSVEGKTKDFTTIAQKKKLNVQLLEINQTQKNVGEGPNGRQLASWVQRAEAGDLSEPTKFNDSYVVATLTIVKVKGVPELDDVREMMKPKVIAAKKGEILAKKLKNAKSLEEAATRVKAPVQDGELTFNSAIIPGTNGSEYAVVGSIFSMKKAGDLSFPLVGENAVFIVLLENIIEAPPVQDIKSNKQNLTTTLRGRAQSEGYQALREKAKIIDNRHKFF